MINEALSNQHKKLNKIKRTNVIMKSVFYTHIFFYYI